MREILFRGKRKDNGEWVEGYCCMCVKAINGEPIQPAIQQTDDNSLYFREVIPETIGQYTGLTDKNGKKIFVGDIVSILVYIPYLPKQDKVINDNGVVYFDTEDHCYYVESKDAKYSLDYIEDVLGNIHDNPELLEVKEDA